MTAFFLGSSVVAGKLSSGSVVSDRQKLSTREIKLNPPPLRSEPTKSQIRGFICSRSHSNLSSGVLFFPEISAIFLFFSENLTNFVALFGPPFGPLFQRFSPVKRLKHPKIFSRASRAEFIFFSNLKSGFYFFQKSQQSHFRGFIFSRNLSNLSIFFQKISSILWHFLDPLLDLFLSVFPL